MLQKGLGHLATPYLLLLLVTRYKLPYHKTICYRFQCLQRIPYRKLLIISFYSSLGSTLLLIKRTTIDPLYLWVIRSVYPNLPHMGQKIYHDMLMPLHDTMPSFLNFRRVLDLLEFKNQVSHCFAGNQRFPGV